MIWAIALEFLKSQWKGMAAGVIISSLVSLLFYNKPSVQVQATQAQSGEIKAGGTLRIAAVPARPSTPCPPKGDCPPCAELPAITLDFGSSAKGGQSQSITATVNAGKTSTFSLGPVLGYSYQPVNSLQIGIKADFKDVSAIGLYGLNGSWTGLIGYHALGW